MKNKYLPYTKRMAFLMDRHALLLSIDLHEHTGKMRRMRSILLENSGCAFGDECGEGKGHTDC